MQDNLTTTSSYSAPMLHSFASSLSLPPSLQPWLTLSYPVYPASSGRRPLYAAPSAGGSQHAKLAASALFGSGSGSGSGSSAAGGLLHALGFGGSGSLGTHDQTLYSKGPLDLLFSISCALGFTILRQLCMTYIFGKLARSCLDAEDRAARSRRGDKGQATSQALERERRKREQTVTRFAEQGWSFLYCTVFWSIGALILARLPAPFSAQSLWGSYPTTPLPALTKFYYLAQLGWWFHQLYVLNTEKRRSDHYQMFAHHILTIFLIVSSYLGNFTRVGTVIHVLMDFCDILLPLAKMFRYLSFATLCDTTFVLFLVSWAATRQIGLLLVIITAYRDAPSLIPFVWDPSAGLFLNAKTYWGFIGMISALYVMASVWFIMACKVAYRVVTGQGAEDSRSDEGDEEDADERAAELERMREDEKAELGGSAGSGRRSPAGIPSVAASASGSATAAAPGKAKGVEQIGATRRRHR